MTRQPGRFAGVVNVGWVVELTKIIPPRAGGDGLLARHTDQLRERLGAALRIVEQIDGTPVARTPDQPVSEREIRAIIRMRRNRDRFFDGDIFADPAWDILLKLYEAALGQRRISISNVCHGAAVPATTALRWIGQLEDKGLIARRADPTDGRRYFLMLSPQGLEAMNAYFRMVPVSASLI